MIADVRKLDHLREDPGWQLLKYRIEQQRKQYLLRVAKRLMAGKTVSPEEIAFQRGYFAGALATVLVPEEAAINLEKAAVQAYELALREESEGEDSPYN